MKLNIFKKKPTHLYSDLKPIERITKLFLEFTFPSLEKNGFKYLKSRNEFKKKNDFFQFSINWYGRKYNQGNSSVEFDIVLHVLSTKYRKWETEFYSLEKNWQRAIDGTRVDYIENWNKEYYHSGWYDLVKDGNDEVMERINENLKTSGEKFFQNYETLDSAIKKLNENPIRNFESIIDFYILQNNWNKAAEFFNENKKWFEEQDELEGKDPDSQYSLRVATPD